MTTQKPLAEMEINMMEPLVRDALAEKIKAVLEEMPSTAWKSIYMIIR